MAIRPSLSRAVLAPGNAEDVKRFGTQLREMFPKSSFRYFPREEPISDGRKRLSDPPDRFFAFSMIATLDDQQSFSLIVDRPNKTLQLDAHFVLAASILSDGNLLPLVFRPHKRFDGHGKYTTNVSARLTPDDSERGQVEIKAISLVETHYKQAQEIAAFIKDNIGGFGLMEFFGLDEDRCCDSYDNGYRYGENVGSGGLDVGIRTLADTPHIVHLPKREDFFPASRIESDTAHFSIQKIERCFLASQRKAKKSAEGRYPITNPEKDPRLSRIQGFVADLDGDLDRSTRIVW